MQQRKDRLAKKAEVKTAPDAAAAGARGKKGSRGAKSDSPGAARKRIQRALNSNRPASRGDVEILKKAGVKGSQTIGGVKLSNLTRRKLAEKNKSQKNILRLSEGLWANINAKKKRGGKSASKGSKAYKAAKKAGDNLESTKSEDAESSPGRVKRSGASCKSSVTELRKMAKKYGGEKGKMYHWCANMKGGKKKSEDAEGFNAFVKGTAKLAGKVAYDSADAITDFATDGQLRQAVSDIKDGIKYVKAAYEDTEDAEQRIDDKCWDGYKKIGTKKKGNKRVNDCVKEAKDTPKKK